MGTTLERVIQRKIPKFTSVMTRFCPKGTIKKDKNTGITTIAGPNVNNQGSDLLGITSSLKTNFIPSATGCKTPIGPAYSGPIRCWAAAEIFLSNQTATKTPTVAPTSINPMGKGIHTALAMPEGIPIWVSDSIKLPCRSIPGLILYQDSR